jgi:hypothetical protein
MEDLLVECFGTVHHGAHKRNGTFEAKTYGLAGQIIVWKIAVYPWYWSG